MNIEMITLIVEIYLCISMTLFALYIFLTRKERPINSIEDAARFRNELRISIKLLSHGYLVSFYKGFMLSGKTKEDIESKMIKIDNGDTQGFYSYK